MTLEGKTQGDKELSSSPGGWSGKAPWRKRHGPNMTRGSPGSGSGQRRGPEAGLRLAQRNSEEVDEEADVGVAEAEQWGEGTRGGFRSRGLLDEGGRGHGHGPGS